MCQQARNIEKFGVANPDRKQRHVLCKEQYNDESDLDKSSSSEVLHNCNDENIKTGDVRIKCFGFMYAN